MIDDAPRTIWLLRFWVSLAISQVWTATAFVLTGSEAVAAAVLGAVWAVFAGVVRVSLHRATASTS